MSASPENGRYFEVTSGSREFLLRHPCYLDHRPFQGQGFQGERVWLRGEHDYPGGTVIRDGVQGKETVFTRLVIRPLTVKEWYNGEPAPNGSEEPSDGL